MKQKLTLLALIFLSATTFAQKFLSPKKPALLGFHYSLVDNNSPKAIDSTSLKDVFKKGDIFNPRKQASSLGVSYWKGLTNNIDFSGRLNGIFYDYATNAGRATDRNEFGAELEATLNLHPVSDAHLFTPFLTVGVGGGHYTDVFTGYVPVGIGFQFNIQSQVYILLQTQYRQTFEKNQVPRSLMHSLGVAFNIGRVKEPKPVEVPVMVVTDRDGDGVVDSLDACPDTVGLPALNGCPDRDGDGVADKDDTCPDVAGVAKYQGCPVPDTDKDGINDEEDKCPNVAGVARYQGCPVPDTDNDGVNDEEDKCPNEAGVASNFGCPEIKQEIIEKVNLAARNVFFATSSSKLLAKSYPALNGVAKILTENPTFKVDIEGHTDSTGNTEKNHVLSHDRANSVKAYLVSKGVEEGRMETKGFGPDQPIAPNKTAAGRAKNRRVEMKLRNY